ncbi:MAG TPA: hypothetical protein VNK43_12310, partial [Gemmatimonadales bacterium]|nr:hypothetical protein [Gemmatimonadales bacterium]
MSRRTRFPLVALLAVAACDRDPPTVPAAPGTPRPTPIASAPPATTEAARAERLAAAVARALRNPHFRADLKQRIDASPVRERKLHFQRFLTDAGRRALGDIARESRLPAATLEADATAAGALELYLPVPEHRRRWSGDENVLVATALRDGDAPVAYDLDGQRYVLDRDQPPTTPVIAIVPAETDFDRVAGPARAICVPSDEDDCAPQGGGGGGGGSPP